MIGVNHALIFIWTLGHVFEMSAIDVDTQYFWVIIQGFSWSFVSVTVSIIIIYISNIFKKIPIFIIL
ncbi:MAG: hypothetical protein KAS39_06690, partial [Actinomycetia bacterium]|nr:hypothetical protein [Actinomycetes bacterium]